MTVQEENTKKFLLHRFYSKNEENKLMIKRPVSHILFDTIIVQSLCASIALTFYVEII